VRKKKNFTPLAVGLAFALVSAQAMGQASKVPDFDLKSSLVGGNLTCTQSAPTIRVPAPLMERAKVKARLAVLLRESLFDDANGIVNVAREKEIRKLANKLRNEGD
jgi:NhaP-type Na+/H+ or K+/H+ antiporter